MSLIRLFGGCLMAAFLVGSLPAAVSQPERVENAEKAEKAGRVEKAVSDLIDPVVRVKSQDGLPGVTNEVLQAWLKEENANVQTKMYHAIRQFLEEGGLRYTENTTNRTFSASVLMAESLWGLFRHVDMTIIVREDCVTCCHILPIQVEPEVRGEAGRLISQINQCAKFGAFKIDMLDTGGICFEYILPFEAIKYGGDTRIAELVLCGMTTIQTHGRRLWAVCGGLKTLDEVWEEKP